MGKNFEQLVNFPHTGYLKLEGTLVLTTPLPSAKVRVGWSYVLLPPCACIGMSWGDLYL